MTVTLTWNDPDDLDLHVQPIEPSFQRYIMEGERSLRQMDGIYTGF